MEKIIQITSSGDAGFYALTNRGRIFAVLDASHAIEWREVPLPDLKDESPIWFNDKQSIPVL